MRDSDHATSPVGARRSTTGIGAGANIWRSLPSTAGLRLFLFALVPLDAGAGMVLWQHADLGSELDVVGERHAHDRGGAPLAPQVFVADLSELIAHAS